MAELKDDINEERRILKEAGILDDKLLEKMDIFPGDRVRFRFYYPHSGFEEMIGHFLGFYTLYEGPEGGGDLNLVIRIVKDGRTTVVYKDRNYLEEYEILEPNMKVRDKIRDLGARHGRHVGHEFGRASVLVDALGERPEARDALLNRRVGAEHPHERARGKRVHDEQALRRRAAERERPPPVRHLEFLEGRGEGERLPDRLRAAVVRLVFPASGDCKLHEDGGDRREDHPDQGEDERGRVPVPVPGAAAEQHVPAEHPRHERDGACERRGDRHDEDVAAPDVRDFMGQDASKLVFRG